MYQYLSLSPLPPSWILCIKTRYFHSLSLQKNGNDTGRIHSPHHFYCGSFSKIDRNQFLIPKTKSYSLSDLLHLVYPCTCAFWFSDSLNVTESDEYGIKEHVIHKQWRKTLGVQLNVNRLILIVNRRWRLNCCILHIFTASLKTNIRNKHFLVQGIAVGRLTSDRKCSHVPFKLLLFWEGVYWTTITFLKSRKLSSASKLPHSILF